MSSLADSEATLSERARTYGLLAVTGSDGIKTYSALLFSVASAPEMSISPGTCSVGWCRCCFLSPVFEAGTFVVAESRALCRTILPGACPQERQSRLSAVRAKLGAWPVTGAYEPSNQLIDLYFSMVADGCIRHVPPSRCGALLP